MFSDFETIINNKYLRIVCGAESYETVIGISVARSDHNLDVTFVLSDAGTATSRHVTGRIET